jgi:hypothetical protein
MATKVVHGRLMFGGCHSFDIYVVRTSLTVSYPYVGMGITAGTYERLLLISYLDEEILVCFSFSCLLSSYFQLTFEHFSFRSHCVSFPVSLEIALYNFF